MDLLLSDAVELSLLEGRAEQFYDGTQKAGLSQECLNCNRLKAGRVFKNICMCLHCSYIIVYILIFGHCQM